jgi:hypothetical protein
MTFNGKRCDQCGAIYEIGPEQTWEMRITRGVLEIAPRGLFATLPFPPSEKDTMDAKDICSIACAMAKTEAFLRQVEDTFGV